MRRSLSLVAMSLAGATAAAQQQPPIRPLGPVVAQSTVEWTNVLNVRALPNNRVLVHDIGGRKLVLLDSTLALMKVVADTTPATATAYSGRFDGLIPYRGDSTLFVDPQSLSMMVIDATGKIARVMSVPRPEDAGALVGLAGGAPGVDPSGRLVYRAPFRFVRPAGTQPNGLPPAFTPPDSAAILRVDLATRRVDTVGVIKVPKLNMHVTQEDKGNIRITSEINPLPVVDDWAVLSDGTVAFVRGRDYHVDFVSPDGAKTSAPKIPFEWQRLTDDDKVAFIDSVKAARARLVANSLGAPAPAGPAAGAAPAGEPRMVIQMGPGGAAGQRSGPQQEVVFVSPSELPDYKPAFFAGAARADLDGNLWVRTIPTRQIPGGPVYDVINHKGELTDRVQVPANTTILGFGPGGDVYLLAREGAKETVERARIK